MTLTYVFNKIGIRCVPVLPIVIENILAKTPIELKVNPPPILEDNRYAALILIYFSIYLLELRTSERTTLVATVFFYILVANILFFIYVYLFQAYQHPAAVTLNKICFFYFILTFLVGIGIELSRWIKYRRA